LASERCESTIATGLLAGEWMKKLLRIYRQDGSTVRRRGGRKLA
jgi:hypothetical protein